MQGLRKYSVGDKIQSTNTSADTTVMKAIWKGEIYKVFRNGYETLGNWHPFKDDSGSHLDSFWDTQELLEKPTLRRLSHSSIELTKGS